MIKIRRFVQAVLLGGGAILATGLPALGVVQYPIVVDGQLADWRNVLIDPDNAISDEGSFAGDPDNPGGDRDLRGFAWTWDSQKVYFWFRRTLSGTNSISFYVYFDRNMDGYLSSTDRILQLRFSGASYQSGVLYAYNDGGTPDPVTGDGVSEPGTTGAQYPGAVIEGAAETSGIELEASIRWVDLGIPPNTPMGLHISAGANNSVEDNMEAFDTLYAAVTQRRDGVSAGRAGAPVRFAHRVENHGNAADVLDLMVRASQAWDHAIWSDPDGDGDPADGTLLALDSNGDGDYADPFDIAPAPAADANGNGIADSGLLWSGSGFDFVLEVTAPGSTPNGALDDIVLLARSTNVPSVQALNRDRAIFGVLTLRADQERAHPGGGEVLFPHALCNSGSAPSLADIEVTPSHPWGFTLYSDPDEDGDPSDGAVLGDANGNGLPDPGVLGPETCAAIVLRVDVPGGLPEGTVASLEVRATDLSTGDSDASSDVVAIQREVDVRPDNSASAPIGGYVFYRHVITNALPSDCGFAVDVQGTLAGASRTPYADSDGNGIPDAAVPLISTGAVGGEGGQTRVVVRVGIPLTASDGQVDDGVLTATAQAAGAASDSALDTTTVRNLLTFSDRLLSRTSGSFFSSCTTAYALGSGLPRNADFRFEWEDPVAVNGPERVSPLYKPDANGNVDDAFTFPAGAVPGTWRVRLMERQGSSWVPVTPGGVQAFEVVAAGGVIAALFPSRTGYYFSGDSVAVSLALDNPGAVDFRETTVRYWVYEDADQSGTPDPGEWTLRTDGISAPWDGAFATHETPEVDVLAGSQFQDFWRVAGAQFANSGTWTLRAAWVVACGVEIASRTVPINVCASLPPVDAGSDLRVCRGDSASIGTPGVPGHSYRWFPSLGIDDPSSARPTIHPVASGTYTLVMAEDSTGCYASDTVFVDVVEPPVPTAIADVTEIPAGGSARLDAGSGFASYLWSSDPPGQPGDGATLQSLSVSPAVTTAYTVTVTDGNGCEGADSITITILPVPPSPEIRVEVGSTIFCRGQAVTLDAGPGYAAYRWATVPAGLAGDGATTQAITISPDASGTWTVTVSDAWMQSASDSLDLVVLETTPGDLGPTLRAAKIGGEVRFSWLAVPDGWSYNVHRATARDFSGALLRGSTAGTEWTDTGAIDGVALYLYQVRGMACFEGP